MRNVDHIDDRWDAIVVGGGPAGAIAAIELVRLGWRTLLIDRDNNPRPKCCGHCLNPRLSPLLERLHLLDLIERASIGVTRGVRIHIADERIISLPFTDRPGWITPRDRLDHMLLAEAEDRGVITLRPARATVSFRSTESSRVTVNTDSRRLELHTNLIIGADGLNSAVARSAGLNRSTPTCRRYGFSFTRNQDAGQTSPEDWIDMRLTRHGYFGMVRARNIVHVGALVAPRKREGAISPRAFLADARRDHPGFETFGEAMDQAELLGAGPMPCRPASVASRHVALVGDAAGYVEPFTGEGMTWAFQSAALLAETLRSTPVGRFNDADARRYANAWRRRIGRSQRRCAFVSSLVHHPALIGSLHALGPATRAAERRIIRAVVAERAPA